MSSCNFRFRLQENANGRPKQNIQFGFRAHITELWSMEQSSILSAKLDCPVARQNFLLLARTAHDCEKQSRSTATETIKLITQDKKRTGICEIRLTDVNCSISTLSAKRGQKIPSIVNILFFSSFFIFVCYCTRHLYCFCFAHFCYFYPNNIIHLQIYIYIQIIRMLVLPLTNLFKFFD